MKLEDIKISHAFANNHLLESKMEACRKYFKEHGYIDIED